MRKFLTMALTTIALNASAETSSLKDKIDNRQKVKTLFVDNSNNFSDKIKTTYLSNMSVPQNELNDIDFVNDIEKVSNEYLEKETDPELINKDGLLSSSVKSLKIHQILPHKKRYSVFINNNLSQVPKGVYNIIWDESLNTYVFENNKELGRVKVMPGDIVKPYDGNILEYIYSRGAEFFQNILSSEKLSSVEIIKKSREGDIVFQTSLSSQSKAITEATMSQITHVGMLIKHQGKLQVLEAVQPVKITDFAHWRNRGKDSKIAVKRFSQDIDIASVISSAKKHIGKPYDTKFEWNDNKIYCSELVYDAFASQGVEIGKPVKLKFLDFSSQVVQNLFLKRLGLSLTSREQVTISKLLKKYKTVNNLMKSNDWQRVKSKFPPRILSFFENRIITPESMFNSRNVNDIYSDF